MDPNDITGTIIDRAIRVHPALGPGLLESTYEACLAHELRDARLTVLTQVELPVNYRGLLIDAGYRIDLLVEDTVIVEVKSAQQLHPVHEAQLMTYFKLSGKTHGLLINFNVRWLKDGIKRRVL